MDKIQVILKIEVTKSKIIRGEAFWRHCLDNTEYVSFGAWMNTQERYKDISEPIKKKLRISETFNWNKNTSMNHISKFFLH